MPATLEQTLKSLTKAGECYTRREDGRVRCWACGHNCVIGEGKCGVCKVRYMENGELRVPFGYTGALAIDPIEKKPFFHALPGATAFSFGMLGCDFKCGYCQNWVTSQTLRDERSGVKPDVASAEDLVESAKLHGCPVMVSTYNEPLITAEWSHAVFELAKREGIVCGFVSNGNATPEVLDYMRPVMNLYKIDLKRFDKKHYAELGGKLDNVLKSVGDVYERGFWLEIVTLVVPNFNDSPEELKSMANFIANISRDIPWHVTAFHSDYKMQDTRNTTADDIERAYDIGREAGLHYVYCGNRPGQTRGLEHTYCPGCGHILIERFGFRVINNCLGEDGVCPKCSAKIPGHWNNHGLSTISSPRAVWRLDRGRGDPRRPGLR